MGHQTQTYYIDFGLACCMVESEFQNYGKREENGVATSLGIAAHESKAKIRCVRVTNDVDFFSRRP